MFGIGFLYTLPISVIFETCTSMVFLTATLQFWSGELAYATTYLPTAKSLSLERNNREHYSRWMIGTSVNSVVGFDHVRMTTNRLAGVWVYIEPWKVRT